MKTANNDTASDASASTDFDASLTPLWRADFIDARVKTLLTAKQVHRIAPENWPVPTTEELASIRWGTLVTLGDNDGPFTVEVVMSTADMIIAYFVGIEEHARYGKGDVLVFKPHHVIVVYNFDGDGDDDGEIDRGGDVASLSHKWLAEGSSAH